MCIEFKSDGEPRNICLFCPKVKMNAGSENILFRNAVCHGLYVIFSALADAFLESKFGLLTTAKADNQYRRNYEETWAES